MGDFAKDATGYCVANRSCVRSLIRIISKVRFASHAIGAR